MYGIGVATVKCKLILDVLVRHFTEENFRSTGKESENVILLQQNRLWKVCLSFLGATDILCTYSFP